jgi:trans-aconitate methyltransferase
MSASQIRFNDGDAYEHSMGVWSRLAGEIFLDWLPPIPGLNWLDVGCGSGAFTELLAQRCSPASIHGIDPAEGLLAFARTRPAALRSRVRARLPSDTDGRITYSGIANAIKGRTPG